MLTKALHDTGLRGWHAHSASLASIGLCITLWIRAKTVDQDERGNALCGAQPERRRSHDCGRAKCQSAEVDRVEPAVADETEAGKRPAHAPRHPGRRSAQSLGRDDRIQANPALVARASA